MEVTPSTQGLTGALIGTVKDAQGGVLPGASVRVTSPAIIGGVLMMATSEKGQLRFPALPPGSYTLSVELPGFADYREEGIPIGAGATLERTIVLTLSGRAESVVVEGIGSRSEARGVGFGSRASSDELRTIPARRASMFDAIRSAPGISPTSPTSVRDTAATTVSAFGSGTNENQFLIDGTNFTCPCNGIARAEPGVDFIQEVQIQSAGASVEFGNVQGAVINVVTRQGSDRLMFDASYYGQTPGLTSQPIVRPLTSSRETGYERQKYRDVTTNLGGPVLRDRLWFFGGYQHLRDYDSQPGADPRFPRTYEQDKILAKLTWRLAPGWQLVQSIHNELWVNPDPQTSVTPFEATLRRSATVPAVTFGHLTNSSSPNTVWDVRVGRFLYAQDNAPSSGDRDAVSHFDPASGLLTGGPMQIGEVTIARTTVKATISRYRPELLGADHEWRTGVQVERGGHHAFNTIPTGVRYVDNAGAPSQSISAAPSRVGAQFVSAAAFASDAITFADRVTLSAGLRFDHTRAFSQDLSALDVDGHETGETIEGLGTFYTWNLWSPRVGVTAKLSEDGRTMLRSSYGRFYQGVMTGELEQFHPGQAAVTTMAFEPATGGYTRLISTVSSRSNLLVDPDTRAPHTDEYSVGLDREIARRIGVAIAYVHKRGDDFIGW
ncbi:MAG TPA: TonB-dependent receptor, partial [Vicinamibacterales bacterium]